MCVFFKWLLWRHFCISRIQIDEAIASTTCVETKKEALAMRILQVRQLLTPPGTCLRNYFERHVRCIAAGLAMKPGKCSWRSLIA